jgi:predicted phosphoribosyltransferase/dienelactone hydrolase
MYFRDRREAGEKLAAALLPMKLVKPVVLGIPRGGVPLAAEVARALSGDLAVVVARKLGAPGNPELAIGATTETGVSYVNDALARQCGADAGYLKAETRRQVREAHRREQMFNSHRRPPVRGRTVIVVDDGVATGATAIAAVRSIRAEGAARVILAIPVGPPGMVERLGDEADEVVCLEADPGFFAVGQYYEDFRQVSDEDVSRLLASFPAARPGEAAAERRVRIPRDGLELAGILATPPGGGPFPLVIFAHGLGSGKDSPRNVAIAKRLVEEGIATLLFDLSGHGESPPDPRDGEAAFVADVAAAFEWSAAQPGLDRERIGIAGSSLGATVAAMAVAAGRARPSTLVLRAPPMDAKLFRALRVPTLVLVGSRDPLRSRVERDASGGADVTVSVVEGAGHLFEEPGTLERALEGTVAWFRERFLRPARGRTPAGRT